MLRLYGGQPVALGNAGAFDDLVYRGGPVEVQPLPYYGGGIGVEQLAGGNFMGGAGSAINPEAFKKDAKQQKIYNKGMGTDNPNEKEIFLRRTGPQLPLAQGVNSFSAGLGNVGGLMAQAPVQQEAGLLQEYAGALLNPFGFLQKAKDTVNKLNERTRKQEQMINEILYNR